ncbi:hypothetical protein E2C01_081493 [Portunus trituberculatus]|uniref:Uncharacterized protein n=1 Tax=Portunus trituberculatus TaxID=210409 RepID=A0A5B7IZ00_PORTR|nr:hypothetical protein [Portunus trituberculatus]
MPATVTVLPPIPLLLPHHLASPQLHLPHQSSFDRSLPGCDHHHHHHHPATAPTVKSVITHSNEAGEDEETQAPPYVVPVGEGRPLFVARHCCPGLPNAQRRREILLLSPLMAGIITIP